MTESNQPEQEPTKPEEPRKARFIQRFGVRPRRCSGCPK